MTVGVKKIFRTLAIFPPGHDPFSRASGYLIGSGGAWKDSGGEGSPAPPYSALEFLALHNIDSLQALLPLGDCEFDFISFMKDLETLLLDG